MALEKQSLPINFAQGLDTKTDPLQVSPGRFLQLENSIFGTGLRMQKRNGFGQLTLLTDDVTRYLTTFNGNLLSVGTKVESYSPGSEKWTAKGPLQPVSIDTQPLIRLSTNQTQSDCVVSSNGLTCAAYTDNPPSGVTYKYSIQDSTTGDTLISPTAITSTHGTVTGSPRVFLLGSYFIIVFTVYNGSTYSLEYLAINSLNTSVTSTAQISVNYTPASSVAFDGYVNNSNLYLAWNGADGGGAIRMLYLTHTLAVSSTKVFAGKVATQVSVCADTTNNNVYVNIYDSGSTNGFVIITDQNLNTVLTPTATIVSESVAAITAVAHSQACTLIYEVINTYAYDGSIRTDFLRKRSITRAGAVSASSIIIRSVGLASKAFLYNNVPYFLAAYSSPNQPTYFLINTSGNVVARLAYSNGGGYDLVGLPSALINDTEVKIAYLYKDLITSVNKDQGLAAPNGIYTQTGVNLATFNFISDTNSTSEIGGTLHLSGGFLWMYDGVTPVEHGFNLWPDNVEATTATTGGLMTAQQYYYQVTYEWTDNQGNTHRSAPSLPLTITTTGTTSTVTLTVPTLRLTYKISNPVKIVIYRWSAAQQNYYQTTSTTSPIINDTTVDYITYVDTHADSAIIGNSLIYTTGGVIEDIPAPSTSATTLYQSRLFLIDNEDKNLLWYSKQVIENTPVEMSDLFTIYVAPTTGVNGSTGPMEALSTMDDKLIVFKKDAIYYINGSGPDNTGANNQFSEPVFITATVGCSNQQSIVFMPNGLMFQSDKGIWLLGRDLSSQYIGAAVEGYTAGATVLSALSIPGTNQIRFTLDSGITLMYDYYYQQWGTFTNIPAISSTLFENVHTYINKYGQVLQETPGLYSDGGNPVTLNFKTGWINLAGLQGFERAYFFYILANYISPHKLTLSIAYDYSPSPSQVVTISPDNYSPTWGSDTLWGGGTQWGGQPTLEQWRIFFSQQKCQAFQITLQETYDPSLGVAPGAGLTISGLNMVVGMKKGYTPLRPSRSVG